MSGKQITEQTRNDLTTSESPLLWEPRVSEWPDVQEDGRVRLIFHGLMGFCTKGAGAGTVCEIGIHKGNSLHPHRLKIEAYENGGDPIEIPSSPPSEIRIEVDNPILDGIGFFQPTDVSSRDELEDLDFRWIVDFESDYLYGKHLPVVSGHKRLRKKANVYAPKLAIKNGLFYTLHKTGTTFRAQTADGNPAYVTDLGSIGDYIAADIYVEPGDVVKLILDNQEYLIHAPGEILFFNDCHKPNSEKPCEFNPYDLMHKESRNDFYINYDAFYLDSLREYELFLIKEAKAEAIKTFDVPLNDEAPCAASGYGGGGGLP